MVLLLQYNLNSFTKISFATLEQDVSPVRGNDEQTLQCCEKCGRIQGETKEV